MQNHVTIQLPEHNPMLSSRTRFFKQTLKTLDLTLSLEMLDLVMATMNADKGLAREDGSHYFYHCVDVGQSIVNAGFKSDNLIAAAIGHDLYEDTWVTYEYIERHFNKAIADMIQAVTKDPNIDYKSNEEALHAYLRNAFSTFETALIKTSDRVHNFGTLGNTSHEKQLRVALETERNFIPLFKWARNEYPEGASYFFHAKTEIMPHLTKIKESHAREQELLSEINRLSYELEKAQNKLNTL